jgi:parvulin-like peptidyl-prolyl isomerase
LARFDGGTVGADELGQAILGLPAEARPTDPEQRDGFYRDVLRQVAMRELLVARGRAQGLLAEPGITRRVREARRQILVGLFLGREVEVETPTPEEVADYFESHRGAFDRPERREVFHIFLRPRPGESRELLVGRMSELRDRSLGGEPFPLLAREHSQSQLRHGDGALGWLSPGQLPPKLDEIVFGLDEGVPSEVLVTASGAHVFLASSVVAAQPASIEDSRPNALRMLLQERRTVAVAEFLATRSPEPADFEPTVEELRALLAGGDENAIVLRIGDWTLSAGELIERLQSEQGRGGEVAHQLVHSLADAERLLRAAESAGVAEEPDAQASLVAAEDGVLFPEMLRRGLEQRARANAEELEDFFRQESKRFAGPLRLRFERLAVPLAADSGRVMGELEQALDRLASGDLELSELARRVGGRVEEAAWKSLADLRAEGGSLRGRLAAVETGGFSEPASNGRELELFHVLDRSEPEVPPLDSVRDQVVDAFLGVHGERLHAEFVEAELEAARFEVFEDQLAAFAESTVGVASGDADSGEDTVQPSD